LHNSGSRKFISIGTETTLQELKTTSPELIASWQEKLNKLNCNKVKIARDY
jgi:hypothetical protein